eukprot:CAMPEP_0170557490 /NCGR_PEP_ID=MMETSP0211-20121228/26542_1 /TAXON_ID=311385 /ORGANISM="Pseudokeronopsis sp., Strain OXSARD2" /LENGTH=63 /DNA_ID=CAMNT_0010868577 /DNA_START=452 /DNA_END=643 /DNA_ORIENTATION=-
MLYFPKQRSKKSGSWMSKKNFNGTSNGRAWAQTTIGDSNEPYIAKFTSIDEFSRVRKQQKEMS